MKLFVSYKKFQGMVEEKNEIINGFKKSYSQIQDYYYECLEENSKAQRKIEKLEKQNKDNVEMTLLKEKELQRLEKEIEMLKTKNRKSNSATGGLIKQINKLQSKLDEANIKLSQRYILKELAPQKAKNTQIMKTKSGARTGRIMKEVQE